jgi:regulator of protease activity HflC (stomatin/prohibitin superfamily)
MSFGGGDLVVMLIVFLAILTVFLGVKTVPQGYNWTVERFGRYTRMLQPGLNLVVPFADRIGRKMNVMEQVIDVPEQEVITKDNATVTVDGIAFFQVFDAAKASYEISSLEQAIIKLTMTNIRSVMGAMDLDQMLSHRDEINERLLRVVDAAVSPWGIKVNRIEIKDIVPPADLIQSMGRQMKAERDKRAEILTAEGQRQSAILKAEGAKQAQILEAEGRREAAFRDAEARERSAAAEAKATEVVSLAISHGDVAALNYFIADKYIRAFSDLARSPNQKVLMMPFEATAVLSSLAGIAEIAKGAFESRGNSPPAPPSPRGRPAPRPGRGRPPEDACHAELPPFAGRLGLVHRRRRAAGAGNPGARRVHAVARARGAPGRHDLAGGGRPCRRNSFRGFATPPFDLAAARQASGDAQRSALLNRRADACRTRVHPGKAHRRRLAPSARDTWASPASIRRRQPQGYARGRRRAYVEMPPA